MSLPMNVVQFAAQSNTEDLYVKFQDYFKHYEAEVNGKKYGAYDTTVSLSEKDNKIYKEFLGAVQKMSGQQFGEDVNMMAMAKNPVVSWAAFSILDAMVEAILPMTIIDSIGVYTELWTGDWGSGFKFTVKPKSLFVVSKSGNGQRTNFVQKQFNGDATLIPENHQVTVQVSLYKVLCGDESLAEFARKAAISIQTEMTKDAYGALTGVFSNATFPQALTVTGYVAEDLLRLSQVVGAYNQGAKPVLAGTAVGISKIIPDGALGYRINTPADNMSIQLVKNFYDYDIMVLPQVATGDYSTYGTVLKDNEIYVLSPGSDKIVKGALEGGTLTNSNDFYDNANLTSNLTMNKRWEFGAITNATAGILKLQ